MAAARLPTLTAGAAQALLAGFAGVGLDPVRLARRCGLSGVEAQPAEAVLPPQAFLALWEEAARARPGPELATRVGLAVPFGAFGALDYLAGSSPRVETGFLALATWFRQVAVDFRLEVSGADGGGVVRLVPVEDFPGRQWSDEFTLAVCVGRFRQAATRPIAPAAVQLARPAPGGPTAHQALLGAPVTFGCSVSAVVWGPEAWRAPLRSADPVLERTLQALAGRLGLGGEGGGLAAALRARLRDLLPEGEVAAERAARALGLSERTLQRRLAAEGATYRGVLDAFREAEAERLLAAGTLPLSEVALRLGFSDQTAWNRAFRRWKGRSPTRWAAERSAGGAPPRPPRRRP